MPRKKAEGLTPREREIMEWIAAGKSSAMIAGIIGGSPHTIDFHRKAVQRKLGVATSIQAVAECIRRGLIQ